MTERTMRDRMQSLGALVLRVGIAAVLLQNGLERAGGLFELGDPQAAHVEAAGQAQPAAVATDEGVQLSMNWASLLGVGELLAAGLLFVGLGTRLVVVPVLAMVGYGLFHGFPDGPLPQNVTVLSLLGVAGVSLLISGGGACSLGRAVCRRGRKTADPMQEPQARGRGDDGRRDRERFVCSRGPSWLTRARGSLGRINPFGRRARVEVAAPAARWWRRGR